MTGTFDNWTKSERLERVGEVFQKTVSLSGEEKVLYKVSQRCVFLHAIHSFSFLLFPFSSYPAGTPSVKQRQEAFLSHCAEVARASQPKRGVAVVNRRAAVKLGEDS